MKTKFHTLALITVPMAFQVLAQGPLMPPGPPEPMMKTLDEVEARIPIESVPFTIDQPGSYYLTGNLEAAAGVQAILITADDVRLDLMGFTLSGGATRGISLNPPGDDPIQNTVVRNGTLDGFSSGLRILGGENGRYEDLQIRNAAGSGIILAGESRGNVIRGCMVAESGSWAVNLSATQEGEIVTGNLIEDCIVIDNGSHGIRLRAASGGLVTENTIRNNTIIGNSGVSGTSGIYFEATSSNSAINGNRILNNAITDNQSRGIYLRSSASVVRNNEIRNNTVHGHDNAGIIGTSLNAGSGVLTGTRIEDNVISWNRFNGGIRFWDSDLEVTGMVIRGNVLADNGVGSSVAHLRVEYGQNNTIQANHLSGAQTSTTQGLRTGNSSGQLVVQNSVLGEQIMISPTDRYGQTIESVPIENSAWLNFRLD
ncbi:MAG: right-handed parallel beta-helix repeat-containing protein [Verrucomicrobia bacterium]|nr:right-handed parallel beta-helix repeat-containing protein [Verrucomicrobiota bacterium]MCH8511237.1 right-handed parallel beta-helix repeat-containing protein [Kiritimatiellia bacterium]